MPENDTARPEYDLVVVGGGLAGLYAAYQLREKSVLVLEAEDRAGGRIRSYQRGDYWANVGAHVYPNPETLMGRLAEEFGLEVRDIEGSLRGMAVKNKIIRPARLEYLPFVLPMSLTQRAAFIVKGLKLAGAIRRFNRIEHKAAATEAERLAQRQETVDFEADRTFAEFLDGTPSGMEPLIRALSRRAAGEPEELSAGAALMCLAHVMGPADAPGATARVMAGGTEKIIRSLVEAIGAQRIRTGSPVSSVVAEEGRPVEVTYRADGKDVTVNAKTVLVATPAHITRQILAPLPPDLDAGLGAVTFGAFLSVAIFTDESGPASTDDTYCITTPGKDFDFLFNHSNPVHSRRSRRNGSSFMAYRGGPRGAAIMDKSDEEIADIYVQQFLDLLPEFSGHVVETHVQRWPLGTVYAAPGRNTHQAALEAGHPDPRVALAGDYFDPLSGMEQAARASFEAVKRIKQSLITSSAEAGDKSVAGLR